MLANFQLNRMIGTSFIGLESWMMDFFGKKHHLGIFFLSLPFDLKIVQNAQK
jgi:hypothetical protein